MHQHPQRAQVAEVVGQQTIRVATLDDEAVVMCRVQVEHRIRLASGHDGPDHGGALLHMTVHRELVADLELPGAAPGPCDSQERMGWRDQQRGLAIQHGAPQGAIKRLVVISDGFPNLKTDSLIRAACGCREAYISLDVVFIGEDPDAAELLRRVSGSTINGCHRRSMIGYLKITFTLHKCEEHLLKQLLFERPRAADFL